MILATLLAALSEFYFTNFDWCGPDEHPEYGEASSQCAVFRWIRHKRLMAGETSAITPYLGGDDNSLDSYDYTKDNSEEPAPILPSGLHEAAYGEFWQAMSPRPKSSDAFLGFSDSNKIGFDGRTFAALRDSATFSGGELFPKLVAGVGSPLNDRIAAAIGDVLNDRAISYSGDYRWADSLTDMIVSSGANKEEISEAKKDWGRFAPHRFFSAMYKALEEPTRYAWYARKAGHRGIVGRHVERSWSSVATIEVTDIDGKEIKFAIKAVDNSLRENGHDISFAGDERIFLSTSSSVEMGSTTFTWVMGIEQDSPRNPETKVKWIETDALGSRYLVGRLNWLPSVSARARTCEMNFTSSHIEGMSDAEGYLGYSSYGPWNLSQECDAGIPELYFPISYHRQSENGSCDIDGLFQMKSMDALPIGLDDINEKLDPSGLNDFTKPKENRPAWMHAFPGGGSTMTIRWKSELPTWYAVYVGRTNSLESAQFIGYSTNLTDHIQQDAPGLAFTTIELSPEVDMDGLNYDDVKNTLEFRASSLIPVTADSRSLFYKH